MRGTLSIKDALTDMSPSMWKLDDKYHISSVEGAQYIHKVSQPLSGLVEGIIGLNALGLVLCQN